MPEDLDLVAPLAPKHEKITRERVSAERLLHLQREAVTVRLVYPDVRPKTSGASAITTA